MRKPWYAKGEYNAICDVCGFKRKSTQLRERWDGLMVCIPTVSRACWEPRHPLEFVPPPSHPPKALPWTRPEQTDTVVVSNIGGNAGVAAEDQNTSAAFPVYMTKEQLEAYTSNFTVINVITTGPVTLASGVTMTVKSQIVVDVGGTLTTFAAGDYTGSSATNW